MRTGQRHWAVRVIAMTIVVSMAGIELLAAPARAQQIDQYRKLTTPKPFSELKPGLTQCLTPERWKQVDAKRALQAAEKESKRPAVRTLSGKEMDSLKGRGIYRNKYFAGTLPWHRSVRDANLCNGNLFKSFTDLQVSPAKGAGLALQRTYNSQDDRIGPFGIGWTHAYDIHFEEDGSDNVPRSDFFGGKHKYHRDADGLYSPPAYLYDKLDSVYQDALVNGNVVPISDNDTSIDGTVKHFVAATGNVRYCTSIVDRYGNQTTLSYQDNTPGTPKLLSTVTDPSGRALTFTWTNLGTGMNAIQRITRVDGPQYSVTYAYNVDANLSSVTLDPGVTSHLNRTTTFGYTTYSDANGSETGLLASVGDALGHTVSYTYALNTTTNTVSITTVTEPAGVTAGNATRTLTWTISGPGPGQGYGAYTSTYTNSAVTVNNGTFVAMDTFLRTTKHFLSPFDYYSTGYDTANNVTGGTTYTGDYPLSDTTRTNITTSSQATYGYHGNVVTAQIAGIPGTNGTAYYDASQYFQKKSMTDANGHTSTLNVGTNTDVNPGNRGSVLWVKDAKYGDGTLNNTGTRFSYLYDNFGRKTQETNQKGVVTNYTYGDAWGNLTQVVQDPGGLNRITSMTYDVAGHVLQSTDPSGQVSTFQYNVLGQPTQANFPAKGTSPAETVTYGYGTNGRIENVTDNRGQTSMAYENGCDRIGSMTDPVTGTLSYTYNVLGERLTMTLPGGGTWTYAYLTNAWLPKDDPNALGFPLSTLTDDAGRRIEYLTDGMGRIGQTKSNEAVDGSNNLVSYLKTNTTLAYNGSYTQNWLSQTKTTWNQQVSGSWQQSVLSENDYVYDSIGQRQSNQISGSIGGARTELYGYDELNRLKTVDYGDGQTQSYSFDAMGNRASKTDVGGGLNGTENYTVNNANMLLTRGAANYTNDANGNTLTDPTHTNTWDSENRLAKCVTTGANAATSSFVYGSDGIRHSSTVTTGGATTTTNFVLDNSMFIREQRAGVNYATYLMGARGPEYRRQDSGANAGQVRWYVYDGLGSVLAEVDPSGNITSKRKYDVYGLVRNANVAGDNAGGTSSHKFVGSLGHPSEDNTGYIYMQARYMDPQTGRFVGEDSSQEGINWFVYCENAPTNKYDPTGKAGQPIDIGSGWWIRIDNPTSGSLPNERDLHWGNRSGDLGSIFENGIWKHDEGNLPTNRVKKAARKAGWLGAFAVCSVVAYFNENPLDCIAILLTCAGEFELANRVDQLNNSL